MPTNYYSMNSSNTTLFPINPHWNSGRNFVWNGEKWDTSQLWAAQKFEELISSSTIKLVSPDTFVFEHPNSARVALKTSPSKNSYWLVFDGEVAENFAPSIELELAIKNAVVAYWKGVVDSIGVVDQSKSMMEQAAALLTRKKD